MKMSKLSNQTNSQDPQAVNSRVFVGNLNTFQCSKTDVERMFQRYGRLAGISMHKGYAFVQFTNPFDARNACLGEDGRNILSQTLDVNMVAEPKSHQIGRSRQNVNQTGNDWEYYYDSYYTSTLFPSSPRPMKRPRLQQQQQQQVLTPSGRLINGIPSQANGHQQQQQQQQQQNSPLHNGHHHHAAAVAAAAHSHMNGGQNSISNGILGDEGHPPYLMANFFQNGSPAALNGHPHHIPPPTVPSLSFKVYSNPDVLICGNCRECFSEITELLDHKRTYCKLRFACKCQHSPLNGNAATAAAVTPTTTTAAPPGGATAGKGAAGAAEASPLSTKIPSSSSLSSSSSSSNSPGTGEGAASSVSARLLCVVCKSVFPSPWDLMVHVQAAHMINIYELGASVSSPPSAQGNGTEKNGSLESSVKDTESDKNSSSSMERNNNNHPKVPTTTESTSSPSVNGNGSHSPDSKEDQHDTRFSSINQSLENGSSAPSNGGGVSSSPETTLRANGEGDKNSASPPPPARGLLLHHDEDMQMFDLENASSSSPISQIEIETGDNKLSNDSALLATFTTCPAVASTPNVAVLGALSIVSSL